MSLQKVTEIPDRRAGHMMYLKPSAQKKLHDEVVAFIASSLH